MATLYSLPTDQVADAATITVDTGTEDSDYPKANLVDGNVGKPAKLTGKTGSWTFDFGSAQRVDYVVLGPHNLDAGLSVKFQGNASASWSSPTVDTTIVIPAVGDDNQRVTAWKDVTGVTGYATGGFRYWRLEVAGTNTANVALGEVWLGSLKRVLATDMGRTYRWGYALDEKRRVVEQQTEYGIITTYDLQTRMRALEVELRLSDAGLTALLTWHRAMRGRHYPTIFVPDTTVNDAWWIRLPRDVSIVRRYTNVNDLTFVLDELAAGLPL